MAEDKVKRRPRGDHEEMRKQVMSASARIFLEKGYTATTLKEIAQIADINIGSLRNLFKCKEDILAELVEYVLDGQFTAAAELLKDKPHDKILYYATETVLQLHIVESSEHIRDLYSAAYSMPKTSAIIQRTITGKLEDIFGEHLPHLETKDFYELEIATGGIMRGFMTIPCDLYFTMERKVRRFIETTFLIFRLSDEKIQEAVDFVSQFDYKTVAEQTIGSLLEKLE